MKQDVLGTVRGLIAKAVGTDNDNEARNAALQACRLIHAHGLLDGARRQGFYQPPIRDDARETLLEDLFEVVFNSSPQNRQSRRYPTASPPPQPAVPPPAHPQPRHDPNHKVIPLARPDFCAACGQRILRGKFAVWSRGALYHQPCWNNTTE